VTRWIFLRHGESEANASRVFSGHQDVELTRHGRTQASNAGATVSRILDSTSLQRVFSSDLQRAKITAEIVLDTLNSPLVIEVTETLRERHLGAWQGESIDKLKATGAKAELLTWHGKAPGGESLFEVALRALSYLMTIDDGKPGPHLLVGHGGLIRTLIGLIDDAPLEEIGLTNINNAEPIVRDIESGLWTRIHTRITG
jgi:broad specificity phosphatase PhoE